MTTALEKLSARIQKETGLSGLGAEHYLEKALTTIPVQDEIIEMVLHLMNEEKERGNNAE